MVNVHKGPAGQLFEHARDDIGLYHEAAEAEHRLLALLVEGLMKHDGACADFAVEFGVEAIDLELLFPPLARSPGAGGEHGAFGRKVRAYLIGKPRRTLFQVKGFDTRDIGFIGLKSVGDPVRLQVFPVLGRIVDPEPVRAVIRRDKVHNRHAVFFHNATLVL